MEAPQEQEKTINGIPQDMVTDESTPVEMNTPQKMSEPQSSTPDSTASARRVTRSQTTGRPTIRWGKYGKDDDDDEGEHKGSGSLKRSFDARAVDDDTDPDGEPDSICVPSKVPKMEPTLVLPASPSSSAVIEQPEPEARPPTSRTSPASGEYTFLDASSSTFTSERRGPRIRTAPPVPVPNLTKKSRGRRVPTAEDAAAEGETEGKKNRVYVCKVEECGKCFSRGEHLKRHIRSIHTHEKPFKCPTPGCDKRFNRNDNLLQHLRVHKGDSSSQTSVDSNGAAAADQSATAESSSVPGTSQRPTSKTNSASRRATRPVRKTKSAASTPPIPAARLAAARVSERSLPVPLPRTYSLPPLPSLTTSYHNPAAAGFMNNTNIAVSSLRTAIDESDGEPETEDTDGEARGDHNIRALYSFARELPRDSFRGPVYSGRDSDHPEPRSSDVLGKPSNVREQSDHALRKEDSPAKSDSASSPGPEANASRAATEEVGDRSTAMSSPSPSPLPSAVSTQ
ncbi:hypothetical protein ID866_3626 [Astraeus odoratus]|nr:hypothetical protein ID866_3626 [Astraeus odoratus]